MAALTTFPLVAAGTAPTFVAASTSDTVEVGNGNNTFLVYRNTDASTEAITVVIPGTLVSGDAFPDKVYTIAAGNVTTAEVWIPLRKEYDAGDGTGRATVTMVSATGITVAVVRTG